MFSHAPGKQDALLSSDAESNLKHVASSTKSQMSPAHISDNEDVFNLDMVTMDMNFEQAYSMYNQIQQKNALVEVEQLQKAQQLSHNRAHVEAPITSQNQTFSHEEVYFSQLQSVGIPSREWDQIPRQYPGDDCSSGQGQPSSSHVSLQTQPPRHSINKSQSQEIIDASQSHNHQDMLHGFGEIFERPPRRELTKQEKEFLCIDDEADEADQFFSTTESNALDKFLDNLAFSSEVNPLEFYHQNQPTIPHTFEMQNMGNLPGLGAEALLDKDITNTQKCKPSDEVKSFAAKPLINTQLRTPDIAHTSSKREREESVFSEPVTKFRRKSTKPLLSLTQKRLNHSNSEQKRRMLCKEAYERCLRLVTNVDDYKNDLVSASTKKASKKKSRRKQLNKDGLPNLSKHSALLKISNEIIKIQSKNKELQKLLDQF
ncbi:hypothetical protein JCM33374_g2622 [Metschnikowia sp. JCM 33374]|nr:hypothetical protein JCM33374_g2622 [Metschnikowia sp. JCM 33374]